MMNTARRYEAKPQNYEFFRNNEARQELFKKGQLRACTSLNTTQAAALNNRLAKTRFASYAHYMDLV